MKCLCVYTTDPYSNTDLSISEAERPLESLLFLPFGISYIATSLKHAGHTVRLVALLDLPEAVERMREELEVFDPQLVCFTAVSSKFRSVKRLARLTREIAPQAYILLGGHHATLAPQTAVAEDCFDGVCVGEGEQAVVEVADRLVRGERPSGIQNLWFRTPQGVERNPQRPFAEDIDSIPLIDRSLWDEWVEKRRSPSLLLGRGCPFKCTYCSNHALAKVAAGKFVRFRSPENVVKELNYIDELYEDVETVYLEVETFSANARYAYALCEALEEFNRKRSRPLKFGINMNVYRRVLKDHEMFERMRRAGFSFINVGLESGSERIRMDVLRRPKYSNDEFVEFCDLVKQHDMAVNVYILFGLPEETAKEANETIDVLKRAQPTSLLPSVFFPYPGTDLYNRVVEMGLIDERSFFETFDGNQERFQARIDYPGLSRRHIRWLLITLHSRVYAGHWPWRRHLSMMVFAILYIYPRLRLVKRALLETPVSEAIKHGFAFIHRLLKSASGSTASGPSAA